MGRERTDGRGPDARPTGMRFVCLVAARTTHALSRSACVSAAHIFHISVQTALPPACLEMAVLGRAWRCDAQTSQTCRLHLGRFATKDTWPNRPTHGVYNAKLSISFTSQSRERDCLFLPALKGSCMTSRCTSCRFVPLFHFSQGLNVVYYVSGPNRPITRKASSESTQTFLLK